MDPVRNAFQPYLTETEPPLVTYERWLHDDEVGAMEGPRCRTLPISGLNFVPRDTPRDLNLLINLLTQELELHLKIGQTTGDHTIAVVLVLELETSVINHIRR
jgi:hypothetical protein